MKSSSLPFVALALTAWALFFFASGAAAQSGWTPLDPGVSNTLFAVHCTSADVVYAVGASGIGLRTTNGGASWATMPMGVNVDLRGVLFVGPIGVAVGDGGTILRSTDSGSHWSVVPSGVEDGLLSVTLSGARGVCGGFSQTILYTTDTGASWQISQGGFFGGGFAGTSMVSPEIAFVGGSNSIFQPLAGKSTDGGVHWDFHPFYLDGNEGAVNAVDFTDANIGHAACRVFDGTGAMARTTDGGASWSSILLPHPLAGVDFPISDASLVGYAVGASGTILKTVNGGGSWVAQNSGTTEDLRGVCFADFAIGYAVGDGGTILKTTTGGEPSSAVLESPPMSSPALHALPNPFAGSVEIRLDGDRDGPITIGIFDLRGRRVRVLIAPGGEPVVVRWDGKDESGRWLASGVYIARVLAPGANGSEDSSWNRNGGSARAEGVRVLLLR